MSKKQIELENKVIDTLSQQIFDLKHFIIDPEKLRSMVKDGFSTVAEIVGTSDQDLEVYGLNDMQIRKIHS